MLRQSQVWVVVDGLRSEDDRDYHDLNLVPINLKLTCCFPAFCVVEEVVEDGTEEELELEVGSEEVLSYRRGELAAAFDGA